MPGNSFLGVFAKSPIKPLEEHITKACEATKLLTSFFEAAFDNDWKKAEEIQQQISTLEREADAMKRDLRLHLPTGLFMPVDRADMLELLSHQDHMANVAKDISGRCLGRELQFPESIRADFLSYVARCIDATKQARDAINELDGLLETGFRGREVDLVERMISKLAAIEGDTDRMQRDIRRELFALEANLNPVDVIFLYQQIELAGEMANIAERVGDRLELLLARS